MPESNERQKQIDSLMTLKKKKEAEILDIKRQLRILDVQIRQK